jgi:hypothetical protein
MRALVRRKYAIAAVHRCLHSDQPYREEGKWPEPKTGTGQGSVISPLLALPALRFRPLGGRLAPKCAQGEVVVVRYANNIILGFQYQTDADRFLENLREGLAMVWTGVETTGNFPAAITQYFIGNTGLDPG